MEQNFRSTYANQPDSKDKEDYILRTLKKRDMMLDLDTYVFKGIDFKEDPYLLNCTVTHFYSKPRKQSIAVP